MHLNPSCFKKCKSLVFKTWNRIIMETLSVRMHGIIRFSTVFGMLAGTHMVIHHIRLQYFTYKEKVFSVIIWLHPFFKKIRLSFFCKMWRLQFLYKRGERHMFKKMESFDPENIIIQMQGITCLLNPCTSKIWCPTITNRVPSYFQCTGAIQHACFSIYRTVMENSLEGML